MFLDKEAPMSTKNSVSKAPRLLLAALLAGGVLSLVACNKADDRTAGEKVDAGIAKTEQAAVDVKAQASATAASSEAAMKQGAAEVKDAVKDAGAAISATVDDATITAEVSAGLTKDADLSAIKIDVDTKAGVVSLKGPAPSAAAKARAEEIAKGVKGVTSVDNQLEVKT
jgi:hyperosmotically inducible protein